jgi:myo-inositol 2-dehydrogenase/D-chiro-inositol 1-dehydrogenase
MTDCIRYGILGCGMMGREHIKNLALTNNAEIGVIAEPDPGSRLKADALAPHAAYVDTLDQLLEAKELDALVIATPNFQHGDQLLRIFEKSELPILVEKPIVTDISQVKPLRIAAENHPSPVWVGMEYRFMPPMVNFREQLESGVIGDLKMLSIREHRYPFLRKVNNWNRFNRNSGGTFVEKCCHFFDLMRLLLAEEPIKVYASAAQDSNHLDELYGGEKPDIIDNGFVVIDFQSGKRALLDLCMFAEGSRYEQEISAVGSLGKIECMIPGPAELWKDNLASPKVVLSPRRPVGPQESVIEIDSSVLQAGSHQGSTYYEHLGFQDTIINGAPVEVTVDDGLKAVVMGMAAQYSASTGGAALITDDGFSFSRL